MKRKTVVIILFMFLVTLSLTAYYYLRKPVIMPPERLANIPKQAEWIGGADGGSWYQITKVISKNTFRIQFYNDGTGDLEIDTTFILNPDCSLKEIDSTLLTKSFIFFDGEKIGLLLPEKGKRCSLIIK